ncbi:MAG: alpha/beta hydrolase [Segetibacter sp.]|jgi:acetyl esterase/lipase|nr:alpha/beta hydrolase [Segetibacter sp.]
MLNKVTLFSTFIVLSTLVNAQEITVSLWPAGKLPNYQKTTETEKSDSTDIVRISKVQNPEIAVFLPSKKHATGQAVVICPGGGYGILAYNWEGTDVAKWLNSKGITGIVLKYRLPNSKSNIVPDKSPLMDAQRAIRMVRANADKWNLKKDKIGIMGFSAGGHLASTAATHFDNGNSNSPDSVERYSSRPDFAILMYPVITMSKPTMHSGSKNSLIGQNANSELSNFYSAELNVTKETPPTFLAHATDDKGVPVENSLMFYQALKDHNIPVEMHLYPKGGHGFGLALGIPETESWTDRCIDWLRNLNK